MKLFKRGFRFPKLLRSLFWRVSAPLRSLFNFDLENILIHRKSLPWYQRTFYRLLVNAQSLFEMLILFCIVTVIYMAGLAYCVWWPINEIRNTWTDWDKYG